MYSVHSQYMYIVHVYMSVVPVYYCIIVLIVRINGYVIIEAECCKNIFVSVDSCPFTMFVYCIICDPIGCILYTCDHVRPERDMVDLW